MPVYFSKAVFAFALLILLGSVSACASSAQIDRRAAALCRRMTLDEKIGQLVQFAGGAATGPDNTVIDKDTLLARGGIGSLLDVRDAHTVNALQKRILQSRIPVPLLVGLDVIHGYRTIFPVPLGMSASWDPALEERTARVAAVEATSAGIRWTFAPMVDIARDARWGRIMEGSGEDPYLGAQFAAAAVRGYQGTRLSDPTSMLACAKHFVAYGAAEGGRDYNSVDLSDRTLRDIYFPPFQAALGAGVGTFMSAFNTVQGVPASASHRLLTDVLRTEWGFQGFVVSDWQSVGELVAHGVARNGRDAARKAVGAGVDMDMSSDLYARELAGLVRSGQVPESVVDSAVQRILRVKIALGLFEHPYTDEARGPAVLLTPLHLALARQAAEESFVLLQNNALDSGAPVLPLTPGKTVALLGPLADSPEDMLGGWSCRGRASDVVTLRQALAARLKDKLLYAKGTEIQTDSRAGFDEALAVARRADVVLLALGESRQMTGEASSRADLSLPGNQGELLRAVLATGKPVVLVVFSGRPLALAWEAAHVPAMLQAWFPGVQAGSALVRTLYGEANPAGKLTVSFPRAVGQMPLYYDTLSTGRPATDDPHNPYVVGYTDTPSTPLFPFGWGLSYTHFTYSPTHILTQTARARNLNRNAAILAEATITNSGSRAGTEIAQVYIRERGTNVARPVRELKGFQRFTLSPGEARRVRFVLTKRELAFWDLDMKHTVEPCDLTVWVAPHALGGQAAHLVLTP